MVRIKKKKGKDPNAYMVPPEMWCGFIKADGAACRGAKLKNADGTLASHCIVHDPKKVAEKQTLKDKAEEAKQAAITLIETPIRTLHDVVATADWALRSMLSGEITIGQANSVGFLLDKAQKAMVSAKKLDPKEIANREFSREAAVDAARKLSVSDARQVAARRNMRLLEDSAFREPKLEILTIESAQAKVNQLVPPPVAQDKRELEPVETLDVVEVDNESTEI